MAAQLLAQRPPHMTPGNRIAWLAGETERAGTVWSVKAAASAVWAIPDGPYGSRKPVLVCWRERRGAGFWEQHEEPAPVTAPPAVAGQR